MGGLENQVYNNDVPNNSSAFFFSVVFTDLNLKIYHSITLKMTDITESFQRTRGLLH